MADPSFAAFARLSDLEASIRSSNRVSDRIHAELRNRITLLEGHVVTLQQQVASLQRAAPRGIPRDEDAIPVLHTDIID